VDVAAGVKVRDAVVAGIGAQRYVFAVPVAVNVTLLPADMETFDPALTDGDGITVTVTVELVLQPTLL
jgi:hypothetical protein